MRISDWSSDVCSSDLCRSSRRACLSHGAEPAPCPHLEWPMTDILLVPGTVLLADWRAIHRGAAVRVDPASAPHITESAAAVGRILAQGDPVYGINTCRSDERRVGEECVRKCRSRLSPYPSKRKQQNSQLVHKDNQHNQIC